MDTGFLWLMPASIFPFFDVVSKSSVSTFFDLMEKLVLCFMPSYCMIMVEIVWVVL